MKQSVLAALTAAALLNAPDLLAQNKHSGGAYVRASLGYAFPHAGTSLIKSATDPILGVGTFKYQRASLGAGMQAMLAGGYQFTRNIAGELGVTALTAPRKFESTGVYDLGLTTTAVTKAKSSVFLVPAIVLSTGGTTLEPYVRTGLLIPVRWGFYQENSTTSPGGSSYRKSEYKLRTGIGAQGALGLMYHIGSVALYGEVGGHALNAYLKSMEVTDYSVNGVDRLYSLDVDERQTVYEFEYTESVNKNEPAREATSSVPFSNVQFNLGFRFSF